MAGLGTTSKQLEQAQAAGQAGEPRRAGRSAQAGRSRRARGRRAGAAGEPGLASTGEPGTKSRSLAGREPEPPSPAPAGAIPDWRLSDIVQRLQEAPALREVLLGRLDEEYQSYRRAIELTLRGVSEVVEGTTAGILEQLSQLERRVRQLEAVQAGGTAALAGGVRPASAGPGASERALMRAAQRRRRRIRWGRSESEIRQTVFGLLQELEEAGEPITTEAIKRNVPGMLRWIYGDRALFSGVEELRRAYMAARTAQAEPAAAAGDGR